MHNVGDPSNPSEFYGAPVGDLDAYGDGWWTRNYTFINTTQDYTNLWQSGGNTPGTPTCVAPSSGIWPPVLSVPTTANAGADTVVVPIQTTSNAAGLGIPLSTLGGYRRTIVIKGTVSMVSADLLDAEVFFGISCFSAALASWWAGPEYSLGFYKPAASASMNAIRNLTNGVVAFSAATVDASSIATMPATGGAARKLDLGVVFTTTSTIANIGYFVNGTLVKSLVSQPMTGGSVMVGPAFGIQNGGSTVRTLHVSNLSLAIKNG
jgi:hypothetical protein